MAEEKKLTLLPVAARCECRRTPAMRISLDFVNAVRRNLNGELQADTPVQTYLCKCGEVMTLTAADLHMVAEAG